MTSTQLLVIVVASFAGALVKGVTGAVQLFVLAVQGQLLQGERLLGALLAGVGVAVALPLGLRLRHRLSGPAFDKVVLGVLLVSAVSLLFEAFT